MSSTNNYFQMKVVQGALDLVQVGQGLLVVEDLLVWVRVDLQ